MSAVISKLIALATSVALLAPAAALACDGEIINLDSVQVYRGIYIATAKVPASERIIRVTVDARAPSAMRIPISRCRCETAYDITP